MQRTPRHQPAPGWVGRGAPRQPGGGAPPPARCRGQPPGARQSPPRCPPRPHWAAEAPQMAQDPQGYRWRAPPARPARQRARAGAWNPPAPPPRARPARARAPAAAPGRPQVRWRAHQPQTPYSEQNWAPWSRWGGDPCCGGWRNGRVASGLVEWGRGWEGAREDRGGEGGARKALLLGCGRGKCGRGDGGRAGRARHAPGKAPRSSQSRTKGLSALFWGCKAPRGANHVAQLNVLYRSAFTL